SKLSQADTRNSRVGPTLALPLSRGCESEMTHAPDDALQLVVVGASSGGVEALSTLVASLPAEFPAPMVIAQHLDPNRASRLGEILGRRSQLPVRTVEETTPLEPGVIYVVPSNQHVQITDHEVGLLNDGQFRPRPSVDLLLSTAAEVFGENL